MGILMIIAGIFMVGVGMISIFTPLINASCIGWMVGLVLMAGGIHGLATYKKSNNLVWRIILNSFIIAVGFIVATNFITAFFATKLVVAIMGIMIMLTGITKMALAAYLKSTNSRWGWLMFCGVLSTIIGAASLINPLTGFLIAGVEIAFMVISCGLTLISAGTIMRKIEKAGKELNAEMEKEMEKEVKVEVFVSDVA